MELIYNSRFLTIHLEDEILIQEWTSEPLTAIEFKKELRNFLEYFKIYKPQGLLWLQENFDLEIPEELYKWIQKRILEPQYKAGMRKLAFTVPKRQPAHLSIIDSFTDISTVLQPRYFASKDKAWQYLKCHKDDFINDNIRYSINRSDKNSTIVLELDHGQLPKAIQNLQKLEAQLQFQQKNKTLFDLLTLREFHVFECICNGLSNKSAAEKLFVSKETIATHRKSIIKKLNIKSAKDWQHYADAFM